MKFLSFVFMILIETSLEKADTNDSGTFVSALFLNRFVFCQPKSGVIRITTPAASRALINKYSMILKICFGFSPY